MSEDDIVAVYFTVTIAGHQAKYSVPARWFTERTGHALDELEQRVAGWLAYLQNEGRLAVAADDRQAENSGK